MSVTSVTRISRSRRIKRITTFDIAGGAVILLATAACLLPILLVLSISLTDEKTLTQAGYHLIPQSFTVEAYSRLFTTNVNRAWKYILGNMMLHSYIITIAATLLGTFAAVVISSMAAYTLSNPSVKCRNGLAFYFVITMLFNTGIVPWYLVNRTLGINDTFWALIVPSLMFSPFNMMLIRNYMNALPDSLRESAKIDGAGDMRICFSIVLPLSLPVLAAVTLFYGLGYWNNWFNAIMLIDSDVLFPIQYYLMMIKSQVAALNELQKLGISDPGVVLPSESLKMATVIVTIGPIVVLYPLLQKYFIKGLVVGGVKG